MINTADILETIGMIREENLDIRTITMGISLFDCVSDDEARLCQKVYDKITVRLPKELVAAFKAKCVEDNISQAQIIREAIEAYLNK